VINSLITSRKTEKSHALTLKAQQQTLETRQAQLFLQLYNQYYNKDFIAAINKIGQMKYRSYEEFWEKYGNVEASQSWDLLSHYFEGAGILVRKGLIDPSLVSDLISEEFIDYWDKMSPFIMEYRIRSGKLKAGENQEYLYELMKKSTLK
jgi:hypothetical protein